MGRVSSHVQIISWIGRCVGHCDSVGPASLVGGACDREAHCVLRGKTARLPCPIATLARDRGDGSPGESSWLSIAVSATGTGYEGVRRSSYSIDAAFAM